MNRRGRKPKMHAPTFKVDTARGYDGSYGYAVFRDGVKVSGVASDRALSETMMDNMKRKAQRVERPCIMCSDPFESEHAGHRMCSKCRQKADGVI